MFPSLISFVGVDAKTDLDALLEIQDLDLLPEDLNEPIIEWGVLVSPQRAGKQNRYPSIDFAKEFIFNGKFETIAKSIHLCGGAVDDYLYRPESDIGFLANYSKARLQLNFAMDKYDPVELREIILDKLLVERHEIILQYNKSKKKFVDDLILKLKERNAILPNLSILYDGSGGFGRTIEKFEPPVGEYFTGYAGGLNPDNVKDIITNINSVVGEYDYYIDMESGIRTNDLLDLEKCKSVIATARKFVNFPIFE